MIHPDTELVFMDAERGRGVRASAPIPRGTIVWARDRFDQVLSPATVATLPPAHRAVVERWGYQDAAGRWILCADAGRFVNHSCDANLRGVGPDVMIAIRDIAAGEEITCDYAECNVVLDPCRCGYAECRGRVTPDDLRTLGVVWEAQVRAALPDARRVAQPLRPLLLDRRYVDDIFEGRRPLPPMATLALGGGAPCVAPKQASE